MRKINEILTLKFELGQGQRQIARSCGIGKATVAQCLARLERSGLKPAVAAAEWAVPEWALIHRELRRKGVTLTLLWHEYRAAHSQGYQYSWFCEAYGARAGKLDVVMRQEHRAGERLFVDYAGQTVKV